MLFSDGERFRKSGFFQISDEMPPAREERKIEIADS